VGDGTGDDAADDTADEKEVVEALDDGMELDVGKVDTVGDDVVALVDVIGTGGKSVAATLPGSGTVPVMLLNSVHSSPL
jgi:hypothetical protein